MSDDTYTIGDHRFAEIDLRRILRVAGVLLDEHQTDGEPTFRESRQAIDRLLVDIDPAIDPVEALVPVVEAVWAELLDVRRHLASAGLLPVTSTGSVVGLHLGSGGVPKNGVDRLDVDHGGAVGDRQSTRAHHGAPFQALCLWSAEIIAKLVADGHPIGPGAAGENVTLAGLDWSAVQPGVRMRLGAVLVQISSFAVPCKQNARWFSDGRFDRIHHRHGPVSRAYATVIESGPLAVGDVAVIEPA